MGSSMLSNHTSSDFQFDNYNARMCANDGCRVALQYTNPKKHQVLNDRRYCSLGCLKKQYKSLSYDGAIHLVHQVFGPEHPVTEQIKRLRQNHKELNKILDGEDRAYIGAIYMAQNFEKLLKDSSKCL